MTSQHSTCPFYHLPSDLQKAESLSMSATGRLPWILGILLLGLIVVAGAVYARDLIRPASPVVVDEAPSTAELLRATITVTPTPTPEAEEAVTPQRVAAQPVVTPVPPPPPSPSAAALIIQPKAADVGWWATNDSQPHHLGDSFLYVGHFGTQSFLSAVRFDLRSIPRGTPLLGATIELTGLSADRLAASAEGQWALQLIADRDAWITSFTQGAYQDVLAVPAAVSLMPTLTAQELEPGRVYRWELTEDTLTWLAEQLEQGATELIVRIQGPNAGEEALFAWDSGIGPATQGNAPRLSLDLGPIPTRAPTRRLALQDESGGPRNVLTAAAMVLTATAQAERPEALTRPPSTPTPIAANIQTVQAIAFTLGLPPVVEHTPTPANRATATAQAWYATAVALTTGTFTPVPTNAVTPIIILPTPVPENVMTAAAQIATATARAERFGTPTPAPYNAVVATPTPTLIIVTPTPTPANRATARAWAAYATAVAMTTGTFTPLPPNAATPTPVPLLIELDRLTPTPPPPPSPTIPASVPDALKGLVLFRSDRGGTAGLYAYDPRDGRVLLVTQEWVYAAASLMETRQPGGQLEALVQPDNRGVPQIYIHDPQFGVLRQLTKTTGWSYDPAWSPAGDRIAFVSQDPGNDEIFVIRVDGSEMRRLTVNSWEWDKHPSWSPDGSQIVFYSNRGSGRRQIWIMNADGSGQRPLFTSEHNDWDPIWVK